MPKYGYKLVRIKNYIEKIFYHGAYLNIHRVCYPYVAIIKLEIPDDAKTIKVSNSNKRRCNKCKFVKVVEIHKVFYNHYEYIEKTLNKSNKIKIEKTEDLIFASIYNDNFVYEKDKDIYPYSFNEDQRWTCAPGIHYFDTIKEVKAYYEYDNDFFENNLTKEKHYA